MDFAMQAAASLSGAIARIGAAWRPRRALAFACTAAALMAAAACGDDSPMAPAADRARGEYRLTVLDDGTRAAQLPATVAVPNADSTRTFVVAVKSGTVGLQEGREYGLDVQVVIDGVPDRIVSEGTYDVDGGGTVAFHQRQGTLPGDIEGELDDGQLTIQVVPRLEFIFVRDNG